MIIASLFAAGFWLLCLAAWFAMRQVTQAYYVTDRMFTDFSGDVESWVRSENR